MEHTGKVKSRKHQGQDLRVEREGITSPLIISMTDSKTLTGSCKEMENSSHIKCT